jgi:NADPH:quinone reductase-like Zn-dependent oxidoreductase
LFAPRNNILGCEFAGEIESIGKNVTLFQVGDKVFGYNDASFGGHAEYMLMNESGPVVTIPDQIPYDHAAAIVEGAHYALCDLRAAKIKRGQTILINGGTGGIGSAAVQLAKYFGAQVTAVCATQYLELVKSLGADVVIDYTRQDFTKIDQQFDIIFDAVGKSSFGNCKPLLKKHGVYMSTELGYLSENIFLALATPFFGGKKVLFPIPTISKEDVLLLKKLIETGEYKPLIDKTYALEQIVDAYRYVETGQKIGNVLIRMEDSSS